MDQLLKQSFGIDIAKLDFTLAFSILYHSGTILFG